MFDGIPRAVHTDCMHTRGWQQTQFQGKYDNHDHRKPEGRNRYPDIGNQIDNPVNNRIFL